MCFAFTTCVSILLTDFLVLRIGLGFGIILYFVYMKYWPSYCTSVQLKRPRAINELSVRVFCFILYQVVLMRVLTFAPSTLIFVLCALTFGPCMVTNACCACFPSMNYILHLQTLWLSSTTPCTGKCFPYTLCYIMC